ncbi:hypothetical protein A0O30_06715 [Pseudomonas sp. LLC-1]|uniref:glycosyltransferase family protein n=1 Tax=Pseudomonas sp. LLC-1 TaxID=1812180 RepID=UPI000D01CC2D|nr:hypothetical protein [Pseudomonas sp. LLC-1]PRN05732.1 hypothetical protein A0O30_06715 [Pseudomonas sp. LLC-1]
MTTTKNFLVCAAPDLNFIDGSSIWAQTITLALASTPFANVDFIAKSKPERDELFQPLVDCPSINIIDGTLPGYWKGSSKRRLDFIQMVDLAARLSSTKQYDVCLVRGLDIATNLLKHPKLFSKTWIYLTDIPQKISAYSTEQREVMRKIAGQCARILCQTEGFALLWKQLAPELNDAKISIYTPVINDFDTPSTPIAERDQRVIYAGKFKSQWKTLEMAESWPAVLQKVPGSKFIVIGDKIHNDASIKDYSNRMKSALEATHALSWLGAKSREDVFAQLKTARVGLSWRAESMNDTVEYSTKILEYGAAGCAAILNRNPLHEQLLGSDYPLFANDQAEFEIQLASALQDNEKTQLAADRLQALAAKHTFSARVSMINDWITSDSMAAQVVLSPGKKIKILVAGHDLKFFTPLQKKLSATGSFEFIIDQWRGHDSHDESESRQLMQQADIIFCEWCLGNVKWFSKNKLPHQKLIARFHAQEAKLTYLAESNWDAIDKIAFVSEHTRQIALKVFKGFPVEKTSIVYNFLDDQKFTRKKKTGDAGFTLGMIGVAPMSKRLDKAIDLLEALLKLDKRYCLRIKGKHPLDYGWLLKRKEEREYYKSIFERINKSSELRHKVIFDPPGDNVNDWLTMVGYILSPSDAESFHMAIGEGMLTGSVPVVWNWTGADQLWPCEHVVESIDQAVQLVVKFSSGGQPDISVLGNYSAGTISNQWHAELDKLMSKSNVH